jgi:glycosyltransferase involved in cell wall biosynthesis
VRRALAPQPKGGIEAGATPSFSIIIAAYQAAPFIADAIESALSQSSPAHEIVVCDDGSTDDLKEAVAPYRDHILFLRQEHRGAAAAKNAAARAASGDFVSILDADDILLPHYLEAVGELASARPDLDIVTTDAYVEVEGRVIGRYYQAIARFVVDDQRRGALHNHFIFGLASLRRSRLMAIGGFDESLTRGDDTDCFLRLILGGASAGLVDEPLAHYRLRDDSLSSDRALSMREELTILERAADHPSMSAEERAFLDRELTVKRSETRLALAEAAARGRIPDARSHALGVAFGDLPPGFGLRTRVNALAAALTPRLAGRFLARREASTGSSAMRTATKGR